MQFEHGCHVERHSSVRYALLCKRRSQALQLLSCVRRVQPQTINVLRSAAKDHDAFIRCSALRAAARVYQNSYDDSGEGVKQRAKALNVRARAFAARFLSVTERFRC